MSKSKSRQPSRQNVSKSDASMVAKNGSDSVATGKTVVPATSTDDSDSATPEKVAASATSKSVASLASSEKTTSSAASKSAASSASTEKASSASSSGIATRPAQSSTKGLTRDGAKYERRQMERQQRYQAQRRRRRNRLAAILAAVVVVVAGASVGGIFIYQSHTAKAQTGPVATPTPFQEPIYDNNNPPVDNVYCDQLEQQVQHIHAHLSIWINGQLSAVPQYVGIPQTQDQSTGQSSVTCYYWLHTHDTTGIIHIESPTLEPFTLGQFLDEWNEQFNSLGFPSQLLLPTGWTIWLAGKPYHGNLESVPMTAHALITIAYNSPKAKPDTTYAWNGL